MNENDLHSLQNRQYLLVMPDGQLQSINSAVIHTAFSLLNAASCQNKCDNKRQLQQNKKQPRHKSKTSDIKGHIDNDTKLKKNESSFDQTAATKSTGSGTASPGSSSSSFSVANNEGPFDAD